MSKRKANVANNEEHKRRKCCNEELDELDKKISVVIENQEKIQKSLHELTNAIFLMAEENISIKKEIQKKYAPSNFERVLPAQPFDVMDDFLAFEEKLREHEFFEQVVRDVGSFAGKGQQDFIRQSWRKVMTDNVAKNICWTGNQSKGSNKLAAKNLVFTAVIRGAFQNAYGTTSASLVEEISKKYFHYAADRLKKRENYSQKNYEPENAF